MHGGRHSAITLTEKSGVPISIISWWAGHYDTGFTMKTYVHARRDDLSAGADLLEAL